MRLLPLLLLCSCSMDVGEHQSGIVGGTQSTAVDYPTVGAIITRGYVTGGSPPQRQHVGGMICTATLIAPDVILTAAHCTEIEETYYSNVGQDVEHYFTLALDVRSFGRGSLDLPPSSYRISRFAVPSNYDRAGFTKYPVGLAELADIGLGYLADPLTAVTPALVLEPATEPFSLNAELQIVGYGQTGDPTTQNTQNWAISNVNEVGTSEIQVGDAPPTPIQCFGDSGGPAFMTVEDGRSPPERLVAVTSRAYDETNCEKGAIDTRTDFYYAWIDETMIAACAGSARVSCAGGGGLLRPASPDAGVVDTGAQELDAGTSPTEEEGCSCSGTTATPVGWRWWARR